MNVDYSTWQPCAGLLPGEPNDQQRDLFGCFWASIGPETSEPDGNWSWSIMNFDLDNHVVADGLSRDEAAAKKAVQDWADTHPVVPPLMDAINPEPPMPRLKKTLRDSGIFSQPKMEGTSTFDRVSVTYTPDGPPSGGGKVWHLRVYRPAVPGERVATMEHMELTQAETAALSDHLSREGF